MTRILGSRFRRRIGPQATACYFHYDAATGLTLTGSPVDVSGLVGTFTRASTSPSVDSGNNAYTASNNQVAYVLAGGALTVLVRPASGGRAVESLTFALLAGLATHSGYLKFYLPSITGEIALLHWGDPAVNTAPEWAMAGVDDAATWYEVAWTVAANGATSISAAADLGAEVAGTTTGALAGVSTAPTALVYLGGRGTLSIAGAGLAVAKIAPGALSLAQLRVLR